MADKSRIRIMVSGNKPRMRVTYEGSQLVVDCARCFANYLRLCKLAIDKKRDKDGVPYQIPELAAAECDGYHGRAVFPPEAYDVIVAHANRGDDDPLIDIPLSLQSGVKTETPLPMSESDIKSVVDKAVADALAKFAAVQAAPLDPALVGDEQEFDEPEGNEPTLDDILNAELGEMTPPMPEHSDEPIPVIASKRAANLAKRHGIDLTTLTPNAAGKITVVAVRKAVEAAKE